jgi:hypothetical protein
MALTFSQMAQQILSETFRDESFLPNVNNAIVSAIKELEIQELFINTKQAQITLPQNSQTVDLPADFISMLMVTLQVNGNGAPPNTGVTIFTEATGFKEITFYQLQTYQYQFNYNIPCNPGNWALYGHQLWVYPVAQNDYLLNLFYYYRDAYPVGPNDTSIWMGDFTQDVCRYKAKEIFYRDTLQSEELAAINQAKYMDALSVLKLRNSQRENINTLSF